MTSEGTRIRLVSREAASCIGKAAKSFLEVMKTQEQRMKPSDTLTLNSNELMHLIKMSLLVTAFSSDSAKNELTEETVHQRETNESALSTALDMLFYAKRYKVVTDVGAIELARSLWLTTDSKDGQIS